MNSVASAQFQDWTKLVDCLELPPEVMNSFTSAIFQIGLTHSSPKVLVLNTRT